MSKAKAGAQPTSAIRQAHGSSDEEDEVGGGGLSVRIPRSAKTRSPSSESFSEKTVSFRPRTMSPLDSTSAKSNFSDLSDMSDSSNYLAGINNNNNSGKASPTRAVQRFFTNRSGKRWRSAGGKNSSQQQQTTVVERNETDDDGDDMDDDDDDRRQSEDQPRGGGVVSSTGKHDAKRPPETAAAGGGGKKEVPRSAADAFSDFSSYHLAYLLGLKAGANAAADGPIGAETSGDSEKERRSRHRGEASPARAAGAGMAKSAGMIKNSRKPLGGDGPYHLGFQHGREHGVGDPSILLDSFAYDIESGEPLTLEQRLANLTNDATARTIEVDSYFDTPMGIEQKIIDVCCCQDQDGGFCHCSWSCCLVSRSVFDVCWILVCALGGVVGLAVLLTEVLHFHA